VVVVSAPSVFVALKNLTVGQPSAEPSAGRKKNGWLTRRRHLEA
jgi:hypothetical protein